MPIKLTEKQKIYAHEYAYSKDPIEAYVKAGYAASIEEAKKSRSYAQPLKSKYVREYLQTITSKNKKTMVINKAPASYPQTVQEDGTGIEKFLADMINNPSVYPKDRISASKLLYEIVNGIYFKNNYSNNVNVGVSIRDDKK